MPPALPPDDDIPWDRLGRRFAGELSAEEEAHLARWLAADPSRERLAAELRELWAVTEPGRPSRDPEDVLAEIRRRDAAPSDTDAADVRRGFNVVVAAPARRPWRRALIAAAVAGLAVGGWWAAGAPRPFSDRPAAHVALAEHRAARGQRLTLTLPDGSTALLAPETTLRYAAAYGDRSREVMLDGEAYFDVVHDDARPFLVRAGNAVARDLGTRFVVRARAGVAGAAATVDVAVTEGRVALSGADRPMSEAVLLDPSDVGRVDGAGRAGRLAGARLDRYVGWTEGRLAFDATPLAEVAAELSRWYDVDVRVEGADIAGRPLTATFRGEPITAVLPMVQASLGLRLRSDGRRFVLSAR